MRFLSTSHGRGIVTYVKLSGRLTIGYPLTAITPERSDHPLTRRN
jgi:hypothetical protein